MDNDQGFLVNLSSNLGNFHLLRCDLFFFSFLLFFRCGRSVLLLNYGLLEELLSSCTSRLDFCGFIYHVFFCLFVLVLRHNTFILIVLSIVNKEKERP